MKKLIFACLGILFILSCSFEMPETLTIRGNPGLYVPLGSLNSLLGEGKGLADRLNMDEMFGKDMEYYIYKGDDDIKNVRTFIIQYNIPLDIPNIPNNDIPNNNIDPPVINITGQVDLSALNLSDLKSFLGEGAELYQLKGHIYITGVAQDSTLSLRSGGKPLIPEASPITPVPTPELIGDASNEITKPLPPHSVRDKIDSHKAIDIELRDVLYDGGGILEFTINPKMTVGGGNNTGNITCDLIIVLPLRFIVDTPPSFEFRDKNDYVKLDFGDALPNDIGNDLFGRTGSDDDLLSGIKSAKVWIRNIVNEPLHDIYLAVKFDSDPNADIGIVELKTDKDDQSINAYPLPDTFSPKFEFLLKRRNDLPGRPGLLSIGYGDSFDFFIAAEASAEFEETLDLR